MALLARVLIEAFAAVLAAVSLSAMAQSFPAKPIHVIVPFPPGGIDTPMRLLGPFMQQDLGQPVVIDNRAGANGIIGSELVARSAPDGYTLLFGTSSTLVSAVFLSKNLPFDPVKDFSPITIAYAGVETLSVNSSVPLNSVKELVDYAKRNPGKLAYASSGIGSAYHLDGELLKLAAGIDLVHVPYKGTGPALQDLVAGRIEVGFPTYGNVRPFLTSGKVKVLALIDANRYSGLPAVPTVAETLPTFVKAPSWIAMVGPAGLPRAIQMRLHDSIVKAANTPEVRKVLEDGGSQLVLDTPEEFAAQLKSDLERTGAIVKALGIQPE